MSFVRRGSYAMGILLATAMLGGCGNPASPVPSSNAADRATTKSGALLYISDITAHSVSFYSYPALAFAGKITGFKYPGPLCTDPRNGNVWVVSGRGPFRLSEYAHGALKPMQTVQLNTPELNGCAVNPLNGDIALAQYSNYDDAGSLLVLSNGSSKPVSYRGRNMFTYSFVGYDAAGDAFVDGNDTDGKPRLDELPSGADKLVSATPHRWSIQAAHMGGVEYDGTDVVIGELKHGRIYRTSDRKVVATIKLLDTCLTRQFAVEENALIVPSACHSHGVVLFYDYPTGGDPTIRLTGFRSPYAVTISQ